MAALAHNAKLRVGVFADSTRQPRWLVESVARIARSDFAEIVVLAAAPGSREGASALWQTYARLDRLLFGGPDPLKATPVETLVPERRRMDLEPANRAWREHVAGLGLDVAVMLGSVDEAQVDGLARYGAWRYSFGDDEGANPRLAALREVIDERPVVSSAIRIQRGNASRIASRSYSRTVPFSIARSHDRIFDKAGQFLERTLRHVHEEGDDWLDRQPLSEEETKQPDDPGVAESLRGIATLGARIARRSMESCFTVGQWSLAFRFARFEPWSGSLEGFQHLVPPADRFWADPFPMESNGRYYIFFEELPFASGKAHISVVEVDREGHVSTPCKVLERDYHLSYPFLVEHEGRLYMIPETGSNGTVEAYVCEEFPLRWRRERVLIEGRFLVDATLHRDGERWWMFANSGTPMGGADDELHLFQADSLLGEWKPHRANPVKSDVRSSRPAGRLFEWHGQLYRPGQICTPLYGSGVAIHRVKQLTTQVFAEEEERRVAPAASAGLLGIHTLNRAGELSVIDTFARRRRF